MATYIIDGRLTRDAEVKTFNDGTPIAKFRIAWNRPKKETHFYDCSIIGDRANKLAQYLTKGKAVVVVGEPDWREYEGKIYETINVDRVSFFSEKESSVQQKDPVIKTTDYSGATMPFDAGDDIPF